MAQEIDLDTVEVSDEAKAAWSEMALRVALALKALKDAGRTIRDEDIPIERGRIEDDGSLTIYVSVPGVLDVDMTVTLDHWLRKH